MRERRYQLLRLDMESLIDHMKGGEAVGYDSLPADAQCVGCRYNIEMHRMELIIESETFEPVPEACMIPYLKSDPAVHRVWKQGASNDVIDKIMTLLQAMEESLK